LFVCALLVASACSRQPARAVEERSYLQAKRAHRTALVRRGPSPQPYQDFVPSIGVIDSYRSADRDLRVWVVAPPGEGRRPAFVYAHGGWALGDTEFDDVRAAYDAGMTVVLPTLRGENGNPGTFEMAYGEVDDLAAAIRYTAALPNVDATRIHLIGHSAGGMISALLALHPDVQVARTASIGGVYTPEVIAQFGDTVPFDPNDALEARLRSMLPFADQLAHPHIAYIGRDDEGIQTGRDAIEEAVRRSRGRLELVELPGDHFQSLRPAVADFVRRVMNGPH